jgi:hypothetical protein
MVRRSELRLKEVLNNLKLQERTDGVGTLRLADEQNSHIKESQKGSEYSPNKNKIQ